MFIVIVSLQDKYRWKDECVLFVAIGTLETELFEFVGLGLVV